jgi:hypothetical protein
MVRKGLEVVLVVSYLQVRIAFAREAKRKLMAQLFCMKFAVSDQTGLSISDAIDLPMGTSLGGSAE